MIRYEKLFESREVTLLRMNKIMNPYGFELVKNSRDKLFYIAPITMDDLYLYHETLDWYIPLTNAKFDVEEIMRELANKILETMPYASEELQDEAWGIVDDIIEKFKIDPSITKRYDGYR